MTHLVPENQDLNIINSQQTYAKEIKYTLLSLWNYFDVPNASNIEPPKELAVVFLKILVNFEYTLI